MRTGEGRNSLIQGLSGTSSASHLTLRHHRQTERSLQIGRAGSPTWHQVEFGLLPCFGFQPFNLITRKSRITISCQRTSVKRISHNLSLSTGVSFGSGSTLTMSITSKSGSSPVINLSNGILRVFQIILSAAVIGVYADELNKFKWEYDHESKTQLVCGTTTILEARC
jgi:hypothetical protein